LAAERILYIPLDDRPVNLAYTVDTFKKAGVDVVTPPSELLSSASRKGNPDALGKWLQEEGPFAEAAVVAADSLIYGGLTTSRTHELSEAVLNERVKVLLDFKARHIDIPIYAFATIMRSPKWSSAPQEPQYYAQWGPKLFLWGALRDKKAMGQLSRKEDKKLAALQKEIPVSIQEDLLQRRQKNEIPVVAIVGYTNAGKSTLLNAITGAGIPANNRLFDTLDTTTRLLTVSDTLDVVISDTVGFIRKLPHQLVEAFKATLEELEYADLLLHVIDVSNPQWQQQAAIVEELIHELKADQIPCIRVYNKCDVAFSGERSHEEDAVSISAKTGEGIPALMEAIDRRLDKGTRRVVIHLPYDKAGMLDSLYREAKVEDVAYQESIDVTAVCPPKVLGQLKDYIEGWTEPKEDWE